MSGGIIRSAWCRISCTATSVPSLAPLNSRMISAIGLYSPRAWPAWSPGAWMEIARFAANAGFLFSVHSANSTVSWSSWPVRRASSSLARTWSTSRTRPPITRLTCLIALTSLMRSASTLERMTKVPSLILPALCSSMSFCIAAAACTRGTGARS